MTLDTVIKLIAARCAEHDGQSAWARHIGEHRQVVSLVLLRKREPTARMLADLGVERMATQYRRVR